jgi:exocyst complex component 3
MDTAGIGVTIGKGLASGTMQVVQGMGNLVTGKGLRGDRAAAASPETVPEAPPPPPPPPSAELWKPGVGAGWSHLLDVYVRRMRDSTSAWMGNMVAADLELPPQQAEGGKLFTPAGVDFFRILNDQLEAVTAVTRGELLVRVVVAISALLLDFQRLQNAAVERPTGELSLEVLCAYVNNNERCYDLSKEMLDSLKELAADEAVEQRLEVLEVVEQGFMDTARAAMKKTVDAMFSDPGFAGVFAALFGSQDWWSGATCDTLCATVVDYFGDLTVWLTDTFFKRFAEAVMERAVGQYCAALFVQCGSIKTGTMGRIAADEAALRDTFAPFVREKQLATAFQTLTDLRELACASTEAEIQAAFGMMLTNSPGTTVDVVERILLMRDDIPKPVKKQIVSACSEQWHTRNGTTAGGLAGAAKALGGATLATASMIQDGIKLAISKGRWFG